MVPAAARSASACTRCIATPRGGAGASVAVIDPGNVSGRASPTGAVRRWTINTVEPICTVSPIRIATRSPRGTGWSLMRVPFTLPRSSSSMPSPKCRQACAREASGSSTRTAFVSPRPIVNVPDAGRLYVAYESRPTTRRNALAGSWSSL